MSRRLLRAPLAPSLKVLGVLTLAAVTAGAQTSSESFWSMRFNFTPPGARSGGIGGAFIALADDATAAESNPAGLTVLLYPQVSIEAKRMRNGAPLFPVTEDVFGPGTFDRSRVPVVTSPTFASAVYPVGRGTLAAFRHEVVNYRNDVHYGFIPPDGQYVSTSRLQLDVKVVNTGVAYARRIGTNMSLGASAGVASLTMRQDQDYVRDLYWADSPDEVDPPIYVDHETALQEGRDGRGRSLFANVGGIVRFGEAFALGATYKLRRPVNDLREVTTGFQSYEGAAMHYSFNSPFSFDVPDAIGAGISSRIGERVTLAADAEWIMYSQLTRELGDWQAKDGLDVRAGAEYVHVVAMTPVAFRAGAARIAPSTMTFFEGTATADLYKEQYIGSVGLGSVLARRWQVDIATEFGDARTSATIALVYFFGRT